jgi:hypothetical protein
MSINELIDTIEWPKHKASLHITHNVHKTYYETMEEALAEMPDGYHSTYDRDEFPDEAEIEKAIKTDSVWTIQWYPNSPVGFNRVHAATLGRALEFALQVEENSVHNYFRKESS